MTHMHTYILLAHINTHENIHTQTMYVLMYMYVYTQACIYCKRVYTRHVHTKHHAHAFVVCQNSKDIQRQRTDIHRDTHKYNECKQCMYNVILHVVHVYIDIHSTIMYMYIYIHTYIYIYILNT